MLSYGNVLYTYIHVYKIWQESNFRIFRTAIFLDRGNRCRETNFRVEDPIIGNLESRDAKATTYRSPKLDTNRVCASSQEAIRYSFFANGQRGKVGTFRSCSEANRSCSWHRAFPGERVDFTDKSLINRIICTRIVVPGQPQHVVIHQTDSLLAQRWNYALWTILRSIEALGTGLRAFPTYPAEQIQYWRMSVKIKSCLILIIRILNRYIFQLGSNV